VFGDLRAAPSATRAGDLDQLLARAPSIHHLSRSGVKPNRLHSMQADQLAVVGEMEFFKNEREAFQLTNAQWRSPQLGALGSLLAHWTLTPDEPALVSLPTGAGKTGVALAAPFLTPEPPTRVLVMVPSSALRKQTVRHFATMRLLREIRALTRWYDPPRVKVVPIESTTTDWTTLIDSDVVVAIPQTISPASTGAVSTPPPGFFDLVIVDEAHHLPSSTWRAVLDHLDFAAAVLLTATPFRLDGRPVPGVRTFYFPLRQAIAEGFYKPIRPVVLPRPQPYDLRARDDAIVADVMRVLGTPEHATSAVLIRAQHVARATTLANRYRSEGLDTEVLTSRLSASNQLRIMRRLMSGKLRAVAVVDMLGEGFDLPRLRVVAYHDKHKSMPVTVQLIGRLARVSKDFPQESVLVTVDDSDVYPELQGVVRELYAEDADWATILPGLVDAEVAAEAANRAFVEALDEREGDIDPAELMPMPRPVVYEIDDPTWNPLGADLDLPPQLHVGQVLSGARILMGVAVDDGSLAAFVTRRRGIPAWSGDLTLEEVEYELSVVSYRPTPRTDLPGLLFIDASDARIHQAIVEAIHLPAGTRRVGQARLDSYLQSLPTISVSAIGMRNILAGTRGTTYKVRAGTSTDTDLLSIETTQTALGHVMLQIRTGQGSTTVGAAFEKGKIWQRRYKSFVDYAAWITEAAELMWFPRAGSSARLLPQIARGRALLAWPTAAPIAVEPNPAVVVGGYQLFDDDDELVASMEDFELFAGVDPTESLTLPPHTSTDLPVVGVAHDRVADTSTVRWTGALHPDGTITPLGGDLEVRRGYLRTSFLAEFLQHYPPLIYFLNGEVTQGRELFDVTGGSTPQYDVRSILSHDWAAAGVDIRAETRARAVERGVGISVHEELENYLCAQPRREQFRWVICNDGSGEIADYIVIEWTRGRAVRLSLWHAKYAGGAPGLRVDDFQVVTAQALRSRSRFNDPGLWDEVRERLMQRARPHATLVVGSDSLRRLLVLLDERRPGRRPRAKSWPTALRAVHGEIAIVQPGLSVSAFLRLPAAAAGSTANSLHQLFGVLADTIAVSGNRGVILGSP
jgi:superfamily II DNA or RNA helicase